MSIVHRNERAGRDPDALTQAAEAIWVAAQKTTWSSLVVVPADPDESTAQLAQAVAAVGSTQRGERVEGLDLSGLSLGQSRPAAETLAENGRPYRRVAAIDCPLSSQTAVLLAGAAEGAVLVVTEGRTRLANARRVMGLVGPSRFVGAVVLKPSR
jgi:hypothetical protein